MAFKKDDWQEREDGLHTAQLLLQEFETNKSPKNLASAIWHIWRFGEYAINAGLELAKQPTDRKHTLDDGAKELLSRGLVKKDYRKVLRQLESYRKKVDYGSYSRQRSVHFNAKNARDCLLQIQSLRDELKPQLETDGKLP